MTKELLTYIRRHEYIYNFLRDDSSHYKYLYNDNRYIEVIKKLAKEKYKLRYTDKLDNISSKLNMISSLIDVFK